MTQEDKKLLLQDICTRLPYNCRVFYEYIDDLDGKTYGYSLTLNTWCINEFVANKAVIKSYLLPMSSITKEEREEIKPFFIESEDNRGKRIYSIRQNKMFLYLEYLNAHHFDYNNLIEKGLALKAPEGMYK